MCYESSRLTHYKTALLPGVAPGIKSDQRKELAILSHNDLGQDDGTCPTTRHPTTRFGHGTQLGRHVLMFYGSNKNCVAYSISSVAETRVRAVNFSFWGCGHREMVSR